MYMRLFLNEKQTKDRTKTCNFRLDCFLGYVLIHISSLSLSHSLSLSLSLSLSQSLDELVFLSCTDWNFVFVLVNLYFSVWILVLDHRGELAILISISDKKKFSDCLPDPLNMGFQRR
ncbi:hypothetical protein L2E82_06669 [Cichorium intybus]|uniref:Uncharacterized protein n=1 Tax=Cichorium intybus TaxID=13427 RepID=A0ACB9HBF7_CICIN|nr:hypothetical protein L2E82_06669 [Cichorium intybus]